MARSESNSIVSGNSGHHHMSKGTVLLTVVGTALFVWVIVHAGPVAIIQQLKALRIALPIVVALSLARLMLQTLSWSVALKNEGLQVPTPRLRGIRLASRSMSYLMVFEASLL